VAHDAAASGTNPILVGSEAKDFDGSTLPNAVGTEGDLVRNAASLSGVQYVMLTDEDGSDSPIVAEDAAISAANGGTVGVTVMAESRTFQKSAMSASADAVRLVANEYGELAPATMNWTTRASSVTESSPIYARHIEETLVAVTNQTTNTTAYAYLDMDGYKYFSLQGETSDATPTDVLTVTVEATNQDDGTAVASCAWQDVTNALFGVASWIDTDFFAVCNQPVSFKYIRVKYVTSNGGGNDADLTVYAKRVF
jgi:hypothetical protein